MLVFPGETVWLALALVPAAILAMLLVNLRAPRDQALRLSQPSWGPYVAPAARWGPRHDHRPPISRGEADVWAGTLFIRSIPGTQSTFIPIRVALNERPTAARLLPIPSAPSRSPRITAVEILECDSLDDALHLRVTVRRPNRAAPACHTLALRRIEDTLVPLDDTAPVTAELCRIRGTGSPRSMDDDPFEDGSCCFMPATVP